MGKGGQVGKSTQRAINMMPVRYWFGQKVNSRVLSVATSILMRHGGKVLTEFPEVFHDQP